MIDLNSRRQLGLLLRRFAAGRITNDELDDALPRHSADPGVAAICEFALGGLYGSLETYRCQGRHRLPKETRRFIARIVLFLDSDRCYEWPRHGYAGLAGGLLWLGTLGLLGPWLDERWQRGCDKSVWPFARYSDAKKARGRPRFLAGTPPN